MLEQFSALIVHPACSNLQYGYGVYIFVEISFWRYLCCSTACRTGERTILRTVLDAMVDDGYVIISVANIPFSRLNRTEPDLFLWSHAVTKLATPARHTGPQPRDPWPDARTRLGDRWAGGALAIHGHGGPL